MNTWSRQGANLFPSDLVCPTETEPTRKVMGAGRMDAAHPAQQKAHAELLHITQQNHNVQPQKSWGIALYDSSSHTLLSGAVSILILWHYSFFSH